MNLKQATHSDPGKFLDDLLRDCYSRMPYGAQIKQQSLAQRSQSDGTRTCTVILDYRAEDKGVYTCSFLVPLERNEQLPDYMASAENTLKEHGISHDRHDHTIDLDLTAQRRSRFTFGEAADILGIAVNRVVGAYRMRHGGEPRSTQSFNLGEVFVYGRALLIPEKTVMRRLGEYFAKFMPAEPMKHVV